MNTSIQRISTTVIVILLFITALPAASVRAAGEPIYYVWASAPSGGNGLSWLTAFNDLNDAIQAVNLNAVCSTNPCQIWVTQGAYTLEDGFYFYLNGGLEQIYGGFAGVETDLTQRDWKAHTTTLVGNHSHVVYAYGFMGILDGFTITGGAPTGSVDGRGGGIFIQCGAPGLHNLNITGNSATAYGGGVYIYSMGCPNPGFYPNLLNVVFSGNSSGYGGGLALLGSSPGLVNVVFTGNSAPLGDGIYIYTGSPTLTNVSMSEDGIYSFSQNNNFTIQNSILWGSVNAIAYESTPSTPQIAYSLVKGCKPAGTWNSLCGTDVGHNLADVDPQFYSFTDLHLQDNSPAINQGSNAFIPPYVTTTDLDGSPRITGGVVDLGAYEFQSANTPPVVTNFTRTAAKNQDITFSAADFSAHFSDVDGDSLSAIRITFLPDQGVLYLLSSPVSVGDIVPLASLGNLHFTPLVSWGGSTSFGWTASDGKVFSPSPATASLMIFSFQVYLPALRK